MSNDQTVHGPNFTCFHAGARESWKRFRLDPPDTPLPIRGKVFLRQLLKSAGLEMSLNVLPPGKGIPILHKHERNDEVYVVLEGRGQFLVDGQVIEVGEGSVVRIAPDGVRAWRNNSEAPMYFLCIQYRAESVVEGGTIDGRRVEGTPGWPI
jgi:mannose-6-phosphate isomerase-like protein (cupin superfamily)